jgi:hypothetical protein
MRLTKRMTSFFGSCNYLPRCCRHHGLSQLGVAATGTKPKSGGQWQRPRPPAAAQAQKRTQSSYDVWLWPWWVLDGEDDSLC